MLFDEARRLFSGVFTAALAEVPFNVWTWVGMDADTKLVCSWMVGQRDAGYATEFIQDLAKRLAHRKRPIWIRFVLVPGLTDDPDDLKQIGQFAAGLGNVERLEVLPFHQLGKYKWERLGLEYKLADFQAPTADQLERTCELFRAEGVNAL